ncbi:peptidase MA superfamily [Clostridium aceticum]|uniref:Peptidase MA superfamily n=2 Tax=Clostridium aceticum TaxID=84022 RepID=A0A0G3WHG6_9CLOT|nr:peptidase MA superfamily [Clostridium aceticum]
MNIDKKKFFSINFFLFGIALLMMGFVFYHGQQNNLVTAFRPMVRDVENRIVSYRTRSYDFVTTDHFIIRYDDGIDEEIIDLVTMTAEDKYGSVVEAFQYKPQEKIMILLYDDIGAFMDITMQGKGTPPMGVYYGNTIHLLNPRQWVRSDEDMTRAFYSEGPLLHELVHLFTDHVGKGNFPIWFTEGVSLYFEYKVDGYEWGKEVTEIDYTIEMLRDEFYQLDEYLAYTQSFRIVRNFVENYGEEALIEIIESLGEGKSLQSFMHLFR